MELQGYGIRVGIFANGTENRESPSGCEGLLAALHERAGGYMTPPEETVLRAIASSGTAEKKAAWIRLSVTNAEAARMLRGADSGVRPLLHRCGYRAAKRMFDIVASGAAVTVLFIPCLVLSAAICIKSPGAGPLYSQLRVGRVRKNGSYRLFRMWKFRSMVPHADEMLADLQDANEADGPLFKIKDDPRVIPGIGTFIRKHSMAPVIIGTPGDGEPTKSLSHPENSSLDLQKCERRPGTSLGARHHYTSFQFLSFAVFGGPEGTSGRHLCAFARAPFAVVGTVA